MEQAHLTYLDNLRESGGINMHGAAWNLRQAFSKLDRKEARDIHRYWMYAIVVDGETKMPEGRDD